MSAMLCLSRLAPHHHPAHGTSSSSSSASVGIRSNQRQHQQQHDRSRILRLQQWLSSLSCPRQQIQTTLREGNNCDDNDKKKKKNDDRLSSNCHDDDDYYNVAITIHRQMVDNIHNDNIQRGLIAFAKSCQDKWNQQQQQLEDNGRDCCWPPFDTTISSSSPLSSLVRQVDEFVLPTSPSRQPVRVLDGVLPRDWCTMIIETNERIGYQRLPQKMKRYHDSAASAAATIPALSLEKNTSEVIQLECPELASYIWRNIQQYVPDRQVNVAANGLIKHLPIFDTTYEKRGILSTIRFMRYRPGQMFSAHEDPQRLVSEFDGEDIGAVHGNDDCNDDYNDQYVNGRGNCDRNQKETDQDVDPTVTNSDRQQRRRRKQGIFRSLFTVAIYLNDPFPNSENANNRESVEHGHDNDNGLNDTNGPTVTSTSPTTTTNNLGFEGGELKFVKRTTTDFESMLQSPNTHLPFTLEVQRLIEPSAGRCVIFRHNELHEAGAVTAGTKYMLQCDVLYECVP